MRINIATTLIDSNLLLRFVEPSHPLNSVAIQAIGKMRGGGGAVHACPQNFTEFWAVATRPLPANGLGYSTARAERELARIEALFPILPDDARIYPEWRRLVTQAGVSGKPTHDARLMAVAVVYSVDNLLTFNVGDFARFAPLAPTVTILDPRTI